MSAKGMSVIICCYNSAKRIEPTLAHLATQEISNFPLEIILVDNASTDGTSTKASAYWKSLPKASGMSLKVIHEPKPGLSEARRAGLDAAQYAYVLFCDDDNHLYNDYCQRAFLHMESQPETGVLGGQGFGKYAASPPAWFLQQGQYFAIGKQAKHSGELTHTKGYVWGAGMVVRKAAWGALLKQDFESLLSDRKGNSLTSGGDVEFCKAIRLLGYKIYYDEYLKYDHEIPTQRMDWKKLRKMVYAIGTSSTMLLPHELHYRMQHQQLEGEKVLWAYHIKKSIAWFRKRKKLLLQTLLFKKTGHEMELEVLYRLGFLMHLIKHKRQFIANMQKVKAFTMTSPAHQRLSDEK